MSVTWRTTEIGTFEIIDRQPLAAKIFGGAMLFFSGCFLYWLGAAVVDYFRFATWREVLVALPGMAVALFMAALFGVPGVLMALLKRRTLCSKADGMVRQVRYFGVFRRTRKIRLSEIERVSANFRTTKRSNFNRSGGGAQVHRVALMLADGQRVEVAQLGKWGSALDLGRQLGGYLGVEFQEGTA